MHIRQGKSGKLKTVVPSPTYLEEAYIRYVEDKKKGISLVCHREGRKILSYRTAWLSACKRAGVKMRPYDIRHIVATEMLAGGADLAAVAAQLGHSIIATTGSTYAHVTPGSQAKAAILMPSIETTIKLKMMNKILPYFLKPTTKNVRYTGYLQGIQRVYKKRVTFLCNPSKFLVPGDRIELPTRGFSVLKINNIF